MKINVQEGDVLSFTHGDGYSEHEDKYIAAYINSYNNSNDGFSDDGSFSDHSYSGDGCYSCGSDSEDSEPGGRRDAKRQRTAGYGGAAIAAAAAPVALPPAPPPCGTARAALQPCSLNVQPWLAPQLAGWGGGYGQGYLPPYLRGGVFGGGGGGGGGGRLCACGKTTAKACAHNKCGCCCPRVGCLRHLCQ